MFGLFSKCPWEYEVAGNELSMVVMIYREGKEGAMMGKTDRRTRNSRWVLPSSALGVEVLIAHMCEISPSRQSNLRGGEEGGRIQMT